MTQRVPKTQDFTIQSLLDGIESGHVPLADFQRDFDWSGPAIRSLLATLLMGWPAGSLLAVDGGHPDLAVRAFEGGPQPVKPISLIVLDGQQRLTALLRSLSGKSEVEYAVSLSALETNDIDQIEEGLRPTYEEVETDPLFGFGEKLVIPLKVARTRAEFQAWRKRAVAGVPHAEREDVDLRLSQVYRDHLHWLHDHVFPVVTLDGSVDTTAIARIFERVNRTGLRLGSFDLVVARAYSHDWNLRDRWEDARLRYPLLNRFMGGDGLPVLQTIALRNHGNVRQSAVLSLEAAEVLEEWEPTVQALDEAVQFLRLNCGVLRRDFLPYPGYVLLLGALARDELLHAALHEMVRYVITRSFGLRFDAAANTRVVEDYRTIRRALAGDGVLPPPAAASAELIMASTRQRQSAIFRAFLCLLVMRGAQDPDGRPMQFAPMLDDPDGGDENSVAVVSLIRRDPDDDERLHLRTLGMVLAHPETALAIRNSKRGSLGGTVELRANGAAASQLLPSDFTRRGAKPLLDSRLACLAADLQDLFDQGLASVRRPED